MADLRERIKQGMPKADAGAWLTASGSTHSASPVTHSPFVQAVLALVFVSFFLISVTAMHITQLVGSPLYFINKDYFDTYMAGTKQLFGLFANSITQWFTPTTIRISGDVSVRGQLKKTPDGLLETKFEERMVLMANHQIYTDWLYLWWISYTGRMHGHIYIILKESLKYIPVIGPGMMFFGFIFMARNWTTDKPRIHYRLQALTKQTKSQTLNPMWLLIFPEGTNLSPNARESSRKWSEKTGLADMQHQILPRSTGLQFCLQELQQTVNWVYDCTISYDGIPRGEYGQDIYTLPSMYFQGRIPKSVNMYWRRFEIKSIPIDDPKAFEVWLRERWIEKDRLLEQHHQTGLFPKDESGGADSSGYIETMVQPRNRFEILSIFAPLIPTGIVLYVLIGLLKTVKAKLS